MSREPDSRDVSVGGLSCPLAPPQHANVYSRALHRACLIVGGARKLASRLKVAEREIERWLMAVEQPPETVFVECVEIILLYASADHTSRGN